jgi:hypothetical protein
MPFCMNTDRDGRLRRDGSRGVKLDGAFQLKWWRKTSFICCCPMFLSSSVVLVATGASAPPSKYSERIGFRVESRMSAGHEPNEA